MPVLESLFNKVAELNTSSFIKKRLQHRSHTFFTEHLRWLLLKQNVLLHIRIGNLDWNESHDKKTKHIHAVDLLHIRTANLDWYKCGHLQELNRGKKIVFVI